MDIPKPIILALLFLIVSVEGLTQSTNWSVLSTAGGHFENDQMQLSWTVGELITAHYTNGSLSLSQGFHQPNAAGNNTLTPVPSQLAEMHIFPNPVNDYLQITSTRLESGWRFTLFDLNGTMLLQSSVNQLNDGRVDMSFLKAGVYMLSITDAQNNLLKYMKILKIK